MDDGMGPPEMHDMMHPLDGMIPHDHPEMHGPGNHVMMHDMMHPRNDHHGINHVHNMMHQNHPDKFGKSVHKMHGIVNPHEKRRWKTSYKSSSSSQDELDGWYAGNKSHDGWHASIVNESEDNIDSKDSMDSSADTVNEEAKYNAIVETLDELPLEAVERLEMEKEDGMIPGLP
jgi:hypothetical protein